MDPPDGWTAGHRRRPVGAGRQPPPTGNPTGDPQGVARAIADSHPTPQAARQAFTDLPDLDSPGEDDGTITPAGPLGSRYAVALGGRFLGYATDLDQATAMLQDAMATDRYWPDAWFISDHGNPHRLELPPDDQA